VSIVGVLLAILNAVTITIFIVFFLRKHCMRARNYLRAQDAKAAASSQAPRRRSVAAAARMSIVALAFSDDASSFAGVLTVNPMRARGVKSTGASPTEVGRTLVVAQEEEQLVPVMETHGPGSVVEAGSVV
jgi:hypothetical protein